LVSCVVRGAHPYLSQLVLERSNFKVHFLDGLLAVILPVPHVHYLLGETLAVLRLKQVVRLVLNKGRHQLLNQALLQELDVFKQQLLLRVK